MSVTVISYIGAYLSKKVQAHDSHLWRKLVNVPIIYAQTMVEMKEIPWLIVLGSPKITLIYCLFMGDFSNCFVNEGKFWNMQCGGVRLTINKYIYELCVYFYFTVWLLLLPTLGRLYCCSMHYLICARDYSTAMKCNS